jgi:hypothetical protein
MTWNETGWNTIAIVVLSGALTFLTTAYWRLKKLKDTKAAELIRTASDVQKQLSDLQSQMMLLGMSVQPLTAAMSAMLVKSLTHFHEPVTDALLAKVGPPNLLTVIEEKELSDAMDVRMKHSNGEITELERNSARLLLLIIARSRLEHGLSQSTSLALVSVPELHE